MTVPAYNVIVAPSAKTALKKMRDKAAQKKLGQKIRGLRNTPDQQGKPLKDELTGFRSLKMARYRIVYRVISTPPTAQVAMVGIRKEGDKNDIYALAKRLRDRGELGN